MKNMSQRSLWMAFCLAPFVSWAVVGTPKDRQPPELDETLLRGFATNSFESFAIYPMRAAEKMNYALVMGSFWLQRDNPTAANAYLKVAQKAAKDCGRKREEGQAWFALAAAAKQGQDLPDAITKTSKAIELFTAGDERELLTDALFYLGSIQHQRGTYGDSLATFEKVLGIVQGPHRDVMRAEALAETAMLQCKLGRNDEVRAPAEEALRLFQSNHVAKGEADCLKILGNQALGESRPEDALHLFEQAANRYRDAGSLHGQGNCCFNSGLACQELKHYDAAITNFQEAVALFTRSASMGGVGIANMQLGRTYLFTRDLAKAEAALELARSLLVKSQDLARLAETDHYLAELRVAQGRVKDALACHASAIAFYEKAGLPDQVKREKDALRKAQSPPETPSAKK